jgi:hypothetical protein
MNKLESIAHQDPKRLLNKCDHYFDIYERYFNKYRNKPVTILEIGVSHGGSLELWEKYFGDNVVIYGLDIEPRCKSFEKDNVKIFTGSQSDRKYLQWLKTQIPKVDILLDDGGHRMKQQIITFEELFDHVKDDGIYICEDCGTSYWPDYGGGFRRRGTYIEYCKRLIDKLNAWYMHKDKIDDFTRIVQSVCFYDAMVVIEKKPMQAPKPVVCGIPFFSELNEESIIKKRHKRLYLIEKILNKFKIASPFN